ncbi:Polypeptide-transport-associated domain protein FtsQ-type [Verrucomicrobia bacterium]|nr:Polypeptide-transport-associated domain protein FtsQ-type [Verrucomicrobiota bacterium]
MWFRSRARNRRLGREYVLDVKLRSSQVRAARLRLVVLLGSGALVVVLGGSLLWRAGAWALDQFVYQNEAFAITELDIQTDGVVRLGELRRWAGVKLGENLFKLDLAQVQRNLELVPLIRSVSLERVLPHTLCIRVAEREPIAQIDVPAPRPNGGLDHTIYQLDIAGYVMLPLDPHQRSTPPNLSEEQFPAISGVNARDLEPGRRLDAQSLQDALKLIVAFEASPMAGLVDLKKIDVSAPGVLVVTTDQGSQITFGPADLEQQLRRWHVIYGLGHKAGKAIATLDLAITNNIPARWLEASALPPESAKSPHPSHPRRKHV